MTEIVTEGSGWYEQPGDRAELDVSFTAVARTRSDAVRALGRRMTAAEPAMVRPGLQVRHRRVRVHNEWRDNTMIGCRAGEDLALVVTDVAELDAVLSALVGAEPTGLNGPRWVLEDPAAALREAQERAVSDARTRAEGYAAALGGTLGPLLRLSEVPEHAAPVAYRMAAAEATGPDVRALGLEPEPVRVTARCTTTWVLDL
ncbi:SIMPL domain-containing protein [Pseudonocardia adelaidensis]|uniref:SIMPL domain-containing protein n=1 Tax=Pseudonocardia adelaidensis TaxID=648754 RepID=A0ABP9NJW3_9PSEU